VGKGLKCSKKKGEGREVWQVKRELRDSQGLVMNTEEKNTGMVGRAKGKRFN